jgi:hypothetical protein
MEGTATVGIEGSKCLFASLHNVFDVGELADE